MSELTARERYYAITHFEPGVRTLLWEVAYWVAAVERWYREGLPRSPWSPPPGLRPGDPIYGGGVAPIGPPAIRYRDLDIHNLLGFDIGCMQIPLNWRFCPPMEEIVLEEDDETRLIRSGDGITLRERRDGNSVPQFVGWPVDDRPSWEQLKEERFRLDQVDDRFPKDWSQLIATYRERDFPFGPRMDGGFFSTPRELLGVENQLVMYYDDPELMKDIASHLTELWLAMLEKVVAEIDLDYVSIWEDMCFKNGPLISPRMFEEFCTPHYRRITGFLKAHSVDVIWVDTDGDLRLLIPKFIEAGVTGSWPLEAQAGVNVVEVRKKYPRFLLMGGMNKLELAKGKEAIDAELESKLPYVLSTGGYIPTCNHMVPPDVSWEDFCYYRERVRDYVYKYQLKA